MARGRGGGLVGGWFRLDYDGRRALGRGVELLWKEERCGLSRV